MIGRLGTSLLVKEAKVETKREGEILYLSKTRQSGLLEDPQQSISRAACLNQRQQGPLLVSSDNRASGGRSGNTPGAFQCLTEGYVRTVRVVCVDSALTILRVDLGTLLQSSSSELRFSIGFSVDMEDIGEGPCSDKR
ncbi:mucin-5AC-like isoform X4 [Vespula squamosa]|uniref:Mucin-5AC-like isoform X4 n=1 Tax=Vespula squamosa TaxID=30214 RepID=A0ABD2C568_VESSQ